VHTMKWVVFPPEGELSDLVVYVSDGSYSDECVEALLNHASM